MVLFAQEVSYEELLRLFWDGHNPRARGSTQYASMIFTHNDAQAAAAEASKVDWIKEHGGSVPSTRIVPVGTFYSGEFYHHK